VFALGLDARIARCCWIGRATYSTYSRIKPTSRIRTRAFALSSHNRRDQSGAHILKRCISFISLLHQSTPRHLAQRKGEICTESTIISHYHHNILTCSHTTTAATTRGEHDRCDPSSYSEKAMSKGAVRHVRAGRKPGPGDNHASRAPRGVSHSFGA